MNEGLERIKRAVLRLAEAIDALSERVLGEDWELRYEVEEILEGKR